MNFRWPRFCRVADKDWTSWLWVSGHRRALLEPLRVSLTCKSLSDHQARFTLQILKNYKATISFRLRIKIWPFRFFDLERPGNYDLEAYFIIKTRCKSLTLTFLPFKIYDLIWPRMTSKLQLYSKCLKSFRYWLYQLFLKLYL